jgi:hypothetical protein
MSPHTERPDGDGSLLLGGLLTVAFGGFAVMLAIGLGWVGAALLGLVLIVVAWKVPTNARVLPIIIAGLGVVALLGALFDLIT